MPVERALQTLVSHWSVTRESGRHHCCGPSWLCHHSWSGVALWCQEKEISPHCSGPTMAWAPDASGFCFAKIHVFVRFALGAPVAAAGEGSRVGLTLCPNTSLQHPQLSVRPGYGSCRGHLNSPDVLDVSGPRQRELGPLSDGRPDSRCRLAFIPGWDGQPLSGKALSCD